MAATREDISLWLKDALDKGSTHLVVACDMFDYTDYPVYVPRGADARECVERVRGAGDRVMEVYNLSGDVDAQLAQARAWDF